MKTTIMASLLGGAAVVASSGALAGHQGELAWAKVVDVEPTYQYRSVQVPVEVCHDVPQRRVARHDYRRDRRDDLGPTIVGGLVGGLIGNQFGGGNGRSAMTVLGTLVGASIGSQQSERRYGRRYYQDTRYRPARVSRQCHTEYRDETEQVVDGYLVTYRYDGHEYTTHMDQHPGRRIRVSVDVVPVG